MRRVLITGAGGFIGRHCLEPLARVAGEVHALVRPGTSLHHAAVFVHEADLFDTAGTERVLARVRPSHLLHLAWTAEPGVFWTTPENVRWVEASLGLLRSFADHGGRRVVLAGSCAEYDWTAGVCREGETPLRPATLYGVCKNALREQTEELAARTALKAAWGRLFWLYGPHEHLRRLVASVITALLEGRPALCSAGTQRRDFLHVQDAADALVALLGRDELGGVINVASGEAVAVREVVEAVAVALGRSSLVWLGALPPQGDEVPLVVADVYRLRHELGWRPRFDLARGLAQTIDWWRCQTHGCKATQGGSVPRLPLPATG